MKVHNINGAVLFGKIDKPCQICLDAKKCKARVVLSRTAVATQSDNDIYSNFMPLSRMETIRVAATAMNDGCVPDPNMVR